MKKEKCEYIKEACYAEIIHTLEEAYKILRWNIQNEEYGDAEKTLKIIKELEN